MAASKKLRPIVESDNESVGLLANGCCGPWAVEIDETISAADRWFAQIEGPLVYLCFEIPSPDIIDEVLEFLEARPLLMEGLPPSPADRSVTLIIGKDKQTPVALLRDDEYTDRYFLVVGPPPRPLVRFSIAGTDLKAIKHALRQVIEDLNDD
jgi:hypothetical protein